MPHITWTLFTLKLRNPLRLSYGTSDTRQTFWLRLEGDEGWGEAAIPPYYGVNIEAMISFWQKAATRTDPLPESPELVGEWVGEDGPSPARCAIDLALFDRIARQRGIPLYELLGFPRPEPMSTSFTIAIDTPEEMARMARQISSYPVIKIKLGGDAQDESRLDAIRIARPDAKLRVDPNAGWTMEQTLRMLPVLEKYGLEMLEQPLPRTMISALAEVQRNTSIPVIADESMQTIDDLERLAIGGVQGVNLKLQKLGGLAPTLKILHRAKDLGLRVMFGCMIESSLGLTAMAHLLSQAEWIDLDSPILISNDPFEGVQYDEQARLSVPDRPGIGALLR
jgi:L-alanine-DL-glutamate epimerase-like enolase superfamily enzyme